MKMCCKNCEWWDAPEPDDDSPQGLAGMGICRGLPSYISAELNIPPSSAPEDVCGLFRTSVEQILGQD